MRSTLQLLLLLNLITLTSHAQVIPVNPSPSLNIGDPAPPFPLKCTGLLRSATNDEKS